VERRLYRAKLTLRERLRPQLEAALARPRA